MFTLQLLPFAHETKANVVQTIAVSGKPVQAQRLLRSCEYRKQSEDDAGKPYTTNVPCFGVFIWQYVWPGARTDETYSGKRTLPNQVCFDLDIFRGLKLTTTPIKLSSFNLWSRHCLVSSSRSCGSSQLSRIIIEAYVVSLGAISPLVKILKIERTMLFWGFLSCVWCEDEMCHSHGYPRFPHFRCGFDLIVLHRWRLQEEVHQPFW
jgi:hypothetical protein